MTSPCPFCGYHFDQELLGVYGCPNCEGEGLRGDRPRLLDLFCGAGGAAMGYHQAGFDVVGVDIEPQPRYPFEFHQGDALEFAREHGLEYDAIHASPPCQEHSLLRKNLWPEHEHQDLIPATREILQALGKPYVIENVAGARLSMNSLLTLCGTMFGLGYEGHQLRRHRLFEVSFLVFQPECKHTKERVVGVYGQPGGSSKRDGIQFFGFAARCVAMGIDWMTNKELSQAIPPAYTKYIGQFLKQEVFDGE